ncbi:MAG: hypothetical protein WCA37_12745 [Terracidiphilus sp.]
MTKTTMPGVSESMRDLDSRSKDRQDQAFQSLSEMTRESVDWAYEIWDDLLRLIATGDNRQRAIAGQILCSLAKSDPKGRIIHDVPVLLALTKDERFVTARHCLLSLWKVAIISDHHRKAISEGLVQRFKECEAEKNSTLLRYDMQCVFRKIYDMTGDKRLRQTAEQLIALEKDPKYRKKYATVWRSTAPAKASS